MPAIIATINEPIITVMSFFLMLNLLKEAWAHFVMTL